MKGGEGNIVKSIKSKRTKEGERKSEKEKGRRRLNQKTREEKWERDRDIK
jgi:hypothetical protein